MPRRNKKMALTTPPAAPELTYEAYLAEGEINRRYDILDGVRVYAASPTWAHQDIQFNIAEGLKTYQRATGKGRACIAPLDILIRRVPKLRTRQPDALFISKETLAQGSDDVPLAVAPELVVEILSDSERQSLIDAKLQDYLSIGVKEVWLVYPDTRAVAVLRLAPAGYETVATYDETQTLQSLAFPDLQLPVAAFFLL